MDLNIYVSYKFSYPGAGVVNAEITYAPAIRGIDDMFTQVENVEIIDTGSPPSEFTNIEDAIAYFYDANAATILSDVESATGIGFDLGIQIRERPEIYDADAALQIILNDINTNLSNKETFINNLSGRVDSHDDVISNWGPRLDDLEDAESDLTTALDAKVGTDRTISGINLSANITASALRAATMSTQTHITDAPTDAPTDADTSAPTDAPTNAPTNYGVLAAILGADANATNTKQNSIGTKLNSVAAIVNANATKQNTIGTKVNTGFGKLNAWFDAAEANNLLAA